MKLLFVPLVSLTDQVRPKNIMMRVQDRAQEFRILIEGKLAGETVRKVADTWVGALAEGLPRRLVVDITKITGCDAEGRKLLREMHLHGTELAAKTPESLTLLAEATTRRRASISVLPPGREERAPLRLAARAGR